MNLILLYYRTNENYFRALGHFFSVFCKSVLTSLSRIGGFSKNQINLP